jgi:hypothetical protein
MWSCKNGLVLAVMCAVGCDDANFVVLTKMFVVQRRASVYSVLKVWILASAYKLFKCVM